jgi:hypothetical protein
MILALLLPGMFILTLIAGCSLKATQTPKDTLTPISTPFGVTYCDINPSDLCLEGFGLEDEDKMLILFKADDRTYANIKVLLEQSEGESYLECLQSKAFPESVYCRGDAVPDGEKIELLIYTIPDETLKATGAFILHYGSIQEPGVEFGITPKATLTSSPGSAYPNLSTSDSAYPNLSTPTSTPSPAYPDPSYSN